MKPTHPEKPVLLFDLAGRPYRFASEEEVSAHRVDARSCSGVAAAKGHAPAGVVRQAPEQQPEAEVSGRHLDPRTEFYHTTWEWGNLEFDGQEGFEGSFFCCHAHFSPVDARAYYDPSCDMLAAEQDSYGSEADGFAVAL